MKEVVSLIPPLRGYALSLTGSPADADDLLQDSLVRVCRFRDQFVPGTNLKAWLYTIVRNAFYTDVVRRRGTVQDVEGRHAAQLAAQPNQEWRLRYAELLEALDELPPTSREALILVVATGLTYEEAAEVCQCAVGTIKSRINRGRERLAELLDLDGVRPKGGRAAWADHRPVAYI
ncbi:MAG: sigma-70 family RNA polymerase sigma factor [Rhizorhabdus sp.]